MYRTTVYSNVCMQLVKHVSLFHMVLLYRTWGLRMFLFHIMIIMMKAQLSSQSRMACFTSPFLFILMKEAVKADLYALYWFYFYSISNFLIRIKKFLCLAEVSTLYVESYMVCLDVPIWDVINVHRQSRLHFVHSLFLGKFGYYYTFLYKNNKNSF